MGSNLTRLNDVVIVLSLLTLQHPNILIEKISKWGAIIFSIFWLIFIGLDYWSSHRAYSLSFENFQFAPLLLLVLALCAGISVIVLRNKKKKKVPPLFNGIGVYLIFLILILFSVGAQMSAVNIKGFDASAYLNILLFTTFIIVAIFSIIVLPANNLGKFISNKLGNEIKENEQTIVYIALGMVVLVFILFLLGALNLLILPVVLPILILPIFIFWRSSFLLIKKVTVKSFSLPNELNWIGIFSLVFLLFFIELSVLQLLRPYPFGFDSLSLYSNLASLIQDYQGLVQGFQPYNWSLLMSIGYVIFGMTEMSLGISMLGAVLSLFALFQLSRRWLNINHALLTILIFYSLPAIVFQTYKDMKIDMGLLFIMLVAIIVFINWVEKIVKVEGEIPNIAEIADTIDNEPEQGEITFLQKNNLIIILGVLAGFSLGIKFTALFIVFGLLGGIWFVHSGKGGLVAVFFLSMFVVLLGRVDDMSGARAYHLSADVLQWVLLVLGLGLLGMLYLKRQAQLFKSIKVSILFVAFFLGSFIHWPVKNYVETQELTVRTLLFGKAIGPQVSPTMIDENWKTQQKGNK